MGRSPPERATVAYAPMPPLKRKKAFAWITVSAVALTGTGAFAQLGIRETSIVFSLFVRFALAALILAGDGAARASAQPPHDSDRAVAARRLRDVLAV